MTNLPDTIKTINSEYEFRLKEKGSLFIGLSAQINSEEKAHKTLSSIQKKYYDASHYCYSYKLQNGEFRCTDDGEPKGTAGIRIYNAQNHFKLTNIITIVVRYFGGVKLGVGLLGKAYYESAFQNLRSAIITELSLYQGIELKYDFKFSDLVHRLISKYSILIEKNEFDPNPKMICNIESKRIEQLKKELESLSYSKIKLIVNDKFVYRPAVK